MRSAAPAANTATLAVVARSVGVRNRPRRTFKCLISRYSGVVPKIRALAMRRRPHWAFLRIIATGTARRTVGSVACSTSKSAYFSPYSATRLT